jgi:hypothetical protein
LHLLHLKSCQSDFNLLFFFSEQLSGALHLFFSLSRNSDGLGANLDFLFDNPGLLFLSDQLNFLVNENSDGDFDIPGDGLSHEDGGSDRVQGGDLFLRKVSVLSRLWVPLELDCK